MRLAPAEVMLCCPPISILSSTIRLPRWIGLGLAWCGLALLPVASGAGGTPLQMQEIGLMLRGGYTNAEVLREVTTRHVVDPLNATSEKTLRDAGADQRLIDALKSGQYTLAPADSEEAKRRLDEAAARVQDDRAAGQDRLLQQARQQAEAAVSRRMSNLLHGKLVISKDGVLQPYDENLLSTKKVFALYYSASWCAPGRQFTPWLIDFYEKFLPSHPDFEVIYVSDDRSAEEMAEYMKKSGMPWPALEFAREPQEPELTRYAGPLIPTLALLDGAGGVHSYSYDGANYLGPRHVIADLAKMAGIELQGDMHDPPPVSVDAPAPSQNVTLSGQPQ